MTTPSALRPTEDVSPETAARKPRKLKEKENDKVTGAPNYRFFLGAVEENGVPSLERELPGELEAQLESLKLDRTYYKVESWKAVADLSNGSIAVQKRPVGKKT